MKKLLITMLIALCYYVPSFASHFAGGEIYYEWNGTDYTVYLKNYGICQPNNAGLPDSAFINLRSASLNYDTTFKVSIIKKEDAKPVCATANSCYDPSSAVLGYKIFTYKGNIDVPATASDWVFSLLTGARANSINVRNSSTLYYEATLDNTNGNNSSAYIPTPPPFSIGVNIPTTISLQGLDVDGDSIVYEVDSAMLDSIQAAPYYTINGYSTTSPLGQNGVYTIAPNGDSMVIKAPYQGNYILNFRIKEYRNGQLISSRIREFMSSTIVGTNMTYAKMTSGLTDINICPGQTHNIALTFADVNLNDSVIIRIEPNIPSDIVLNAVISDGVNYGSAQLNIAAQQSLNPQTLPYFYINMLVYDDGCPRAATKYSVLVRTRACTADSVWPGDANSDKVVNLLDPLTVALSYGQTGTARSGNPLVWAGDYVANWGTNITGTAIDIKHADCDGDGVIGFSDLSTISTHWGKTHAKDGPRQKTTAAPDLYFDMTGIGFVAPGATIDVPIMLGTPLVQVDPGFYGVGTRLGATINGNLLSSQTTVTHSYSWMGSSSNTLNFNKNIDNSTVYWAFSRTDGTGIQSAGNGQIGVLRYTVPSTAVDGDRIDLTLRETVMMNANGSLITDFNTIDAVAYVASLSVDGREQVFGNASIVPNPSVNMAVLNVTLQNREQIALTVLDITGKQLWHEASELGSGTHQIALPASELPAGVYMVRIANGDGIQQTLKWVKQ